MRFGFGMAARGKLTASLGARSVPSPLVATAPSEWRASGPAALVRREPFLPLGQHVPVFFLHIPRTSGASLQCFLRRFYAADALHDGVEVLVSDILAGRRDPVQGDCLTGALPLMRWEMFRGSDAFKRVTILRDPWARLVSHINRLAVLGPDGAGPDGSAQRSLAAEVAQADFTSRVGLERFRRRLQPMEGGFDNLQTRMLLTGTMSALVKTLTPRDVDKAAANLSEFALVGLCEDQVSLQRAMLRLIGKDGHPEGLYECSGKPVALSPRNDLAREVLEPMFHFDQDLYTRAKAMIAARQV